MINLSKIDTIDELKKAIEGLPESTSSLSAAEVTRLKSLAIAELDVVSRLPKVNGASINFKANTIGNWRQVEIQVSGRWIEPKAE